MLEATDRPWGRPHLVCIVVHLMTGTPLGCPSSAAESAPRVGRPVRADRRPRQSCGQMTSAELRPDDLGRAAARRPRQSCGQMTSAELRPADIADRGYGSAMPRAPNETAADIGLKYRRITDGSPRRYRQGGNRWLVAAYAGPAVIWQHGRDFSYYSAGLCVKKALCYDRFLTSSDVGICKRDTQIDRLDSFVYLFFIVKISN